MTKLFRLALSSTLLLAALAAAQENIPVSGVTVVPAKPAKPDVARLRKTLQLPPGLADKAVEDRHDVYLVKVQAEVDYGPAQTVLSIGGKEVTGFGAYDGGIFVRVYDPRTLDEWAGQEVRVYTKGPGGEVPEPDTGATVRVPSRTLRSLSRERPTVDEALRAGR